MKCNYLKTGLLTLLCMLPGLSATFAQQEKAMITDIRHYQKVKFNAELGEYFEEGVDFKNMVFGVIEKQTREKFNVDDVDFQEDDKIKYVDWGLPGKLNIKDIDPGIADIFISVTSTGYYSPQVKIDLTYSLKTEVLVKNSKGKTIFKNKVVQDFKSLKGDYLIGNDIISFEDFSKLFEQGLIAGFQTEKMNFELQTVMHPISPYYYEFINESERVTLIIDSDQYRIMGENGEETRLLSYHRLIGSGYDGPKSKAKRRFTLENHLIDSIYKVVAETSDGSWLVDFISNYSAPLVTFESGNVISAKYGYNDFELHGTAGFSTYRVIWFPQLHMFEVLANDNLIALIQRRNEGILQTSHTGTHLTYISNSLNSYEKGLLFNAVFAYVQAYNVYQELISDDN